jgi:hypothetical protein
MVFTTKRFAGVLLVIAGAAACASPQGKADKAIAAADSALQATSADAQAYVPDQFTALNDELTAARSDVEAKKYADASMKAAEVSSKVAELPAAIATAKQQLTASWQSMADSLPAMVQAIQAKVDQMAKMRRLPAGMDKAKMDAAKTSVTEMTASWTQAMDAYKGGKLAEAVNLATGLKTKANQTMSSLGMQK